MTLKTRLSVKVVPPQPAVADPAAFEETVVEPVVIERPTGSLNVVEASIVSIRAVDIRFVSDEVVQELGVGEPESIEL